MKRSVSINEKMWMETDGKNIIIFIFDGETTYEYNLKNGNPIEILEQIAITVGDW